MKQFFQLLCLTFALSGTVWTSEFVWGTEPNVDPAYRADMQSAFERLTDAANAGVEDALERKDSPSKGVGIKRFKIEGPTMPVASYVGDQNSGDSDDSVANICVKVCFELADGTFVNPLKSTWKPKERFYVHIQTSVPLFVLLFQTDPETGESQTIYPSEKYENSMQVIQAEEAIRLPVVVSLDDDCKDKTLSLVVVRADWFGICDELTGGRPAAESVERRNGRAEVTAQLTEKAVGIIKSLDDVVRTKKKATYEQICKDVSELDEERTSEIAEEIDEIAPYVEFSISASLEETKDSDDVGVATASKAVSFYMCGTEDVGQWTFKIKKNSKNKK